MESLSYGRLLHVGVRQRLSILEPAFERFVEINHHDDAGLNRDSEERDVADRHCNAEVVVKKPLQEQSPTHCIDGGEDEDKRFGDRVKDQIKQ